MNLMNLVGMLLGKEQSGESEEEVDANDVGMQIGKSVGTIPTDLLLVGRTLGLLDGITRQLDPGMDTMEIVAHYA
jgi:ubiquinone biosynthesis protein